MSGLDGWETRSVASLCSEVVSGGTPSRRNPSYFDGDIPWVKTMDLFDGPVARTDETISKLGLESSSAKLLPADTTLIAMYGATVGKLGYLTIEATCNQAACGLVADPEQADSRWLFYAMLDSRHRLINLASGAAQQNLNVALVRNHELIAPPLPQQQAIAEVLGALDDKIAANRRVVEQGVDLIDALYAQAPKSRRDLAFKDVASLGGGGTPSTKNDSFWGDQHRWATPTDVTGLQGPWLLDTSRRISNEGLARITSKLYPRGSILMSSRASIGHCALATHQTAVNQGFIVLVPNQADMRGWLFAQLRARNNEFLAWANGATFLELPKGVFRNLPVDMPDEGTLRKFSAVVEPLLEKMEALQKENIALARARDELLPLLMSGRMKVRDAQARVEEVM